MHFKENIYHTNHYVFWKDSTDLQKLLKKEGLEIEMGENDTAKTTFFYGSKNYNYLTIAVFDKKKWRNRTKAMNAGLIAHEAWHATEFSLFNIGMGINTSVSPNEHFAYYLGFVAENYAKFLYKQLIN
jgi:hypothetical protein